MPVLLFVQDHDLAGHFSNMVGAARKHWPVRVGVPFPKGKLRQVEGLTLLDRNRSLPFQPQVTKRWPDGSIQWISGLALVDLAVSQTKQLSLVVAAGVDRGVSSTKAKPRSTPAATTVTESEHGFTLANEFLRIEISRTLDLFRVCREETALADTPPVFELVTEDGNVLQPRWTSARVESDGSLRGRVSLRGHYESANGDPSFDVEFGLDLTAGQSWVECFHRLTHKVPGAPAIRVRRLALRQDWALAHPHYVVRQSHRGHEWLPRDVRKPGHVEVRVTGQRAHVSDHAMVDEIVESYPPYLRRGLDSVEPWLAASDAKQTILFWTPEPLGHSPQTWSLDGSRMTIEFVPGWSEPAEFPQGRAKTHRWRWHFADTPPAPSLEDVTNPKRCVVSPYNQIALLHTLPPLVSVDPAWARRCEPMLARSLECAPRRHPRFEGMLNRLFDIAWPKGMMNWGDDVDPGYTKNYAASGVKLEGAVWTNNEYDFIYATIHQMLRTGQARFWRTIERSAHHALDVDFVHYSDDPWLHHGSPAHSVRHTTASSYPSHIWTEGLLHYYYLSGDTRALDVARQSGEFILRYQKKKWWVFEETARESGWALLALTELYAATGERAFLDGALRIKDFVVEGTAKRHPLFPGEASFFIGVLVMGLDKLHDHHPDARIPKTIDRILQWRLDNRLSPEGIPLYHWDASARMVNTREIMFPAALAVGYRHTRQRRYLDVLWRCLQYWLDTDALQNSPLCTKSAAAFYRTWIEGLGQLARARRLSRVEFTS